MNRRALVKVTILVLFVAGAVCLVRFSPAQPYFTTDYLGKFLEAAGIWAPLVFLIIYAAGVCLFIPGTLLTAHTGGSCTCGWAPCPAPSSPF